MNISFQCKACDADFELGITDIVESPNTIKCGNCGSGPPDHRSHQFSTALEDFLAAITAIRNKVSFDVNLESDNLPSPYGSLEEGDDQGGLDGGLAFGQQDHSPREMNEDLEDDEDEMDCMSEVEEGEKEEGGQGFSALGDEDFDEDDEDFDEDDEDFDEDDEDFDDDFDELEDDEDDFDELKDDEDDEDDF